MNRIFGLFLVFFSVGLGYVLSHGDLRALWQPFEIIIICGAALGAFITANTPKLIWAICRRMPSLLVGSPYSKKLYMELLSMLYEIFDKWRREGMVGIETDVEEPHNSRIFSRYPRVIKEPRAINFVTDYLRIITIGNLSATELESLIDAEIDTVFEEAESSANSLNAVADSLPGFGIVAAVLGIVISMKSLAGPPELLGMHVASALVGTFLGILLSYGVVGPLSKGLEQMAKEETKFLECIKVSLLAMLQGIPPVMAVEFGRKTLYSTERPSFRELEKHIRAIK